MTYEKGWNKKLTYCIAFDLNCITDVTMRYVKDYEACLTRRTTVSEKWLSESLNEYRDQMWKELSEDQIEEQLNIYKQDNIHMGNKENAKNTELIKRFWKQG